MRLAPPQACQILVSIDLGLLFVFFFATPLPPFYSLSLLAVVFCDAPVRRGFLAPSNTQYELQKIAQTRNLPTSGRGRSVCSVGRVEQLFLYRTW